MHRRWSLSEESDRQARRVRSLVAAIIVASSGWYLAEVLDKAQPLRNWLVIDLARLWGWELVLTVACLSVGHWLLLRLNLDLSLLEKIALALPLGLISFVVGIYLFGYMGLLGPAFAVLQPSVFVLVGASSSLSLLREVQAAYVARTPWSGPAMIGAAFGVLGLSLVYLGILSPDAINYDASWNLISDNYSYSRDDNYSYSRPATRTLLVLSVAEMT